MAAKRNRAKRKIRRKKNSIRLFVMLFVAALAVAGISILKSDIFVVRQLTILGSALLPQEAYLEACPVKPGAHQFGFNASVVREQIMDKLPIAKDVKVKRILPSGIEITVTERSAEMIISCDGVYYTLDDTGFVYWAVDRLSVVDALIVSGLEGLDIRIGEVFEFYQSPGAQTASQVARYLKSSGLTSMVSELEIRDTAYYLYTSHSNVIKFVSMKAFMSNEPFVVEFLNFDERQIMVELVEGRNPAYRAIRTD